MKKLFFLFFSAMIFFNADGQINYETTYLLSPMIKYFNHASPKWMTRTYYSDTITLYNLNHSLYRQIIVPPQPTTCLAYFLSEDLFDSDSTTLEYLVASNSAPYFVKIYREDGTLLFARDSALIGNAALISNWDFYSNVMSTDSGTKLMMCIYNPPYTRYEIYSLPGILPCPNTCGVIGTTPTIVQGLPVEIKKYNPNNPYPNPTNNQTHIPFELPLGINKGEIVFYDLAGSEVKRYTVDRTFRDLILSAADLSAGSYYYQVQTAGGNSKGQKLIVIK
jgi:hypothetical protein